MSTNEDSSLINSNQKSSLGVRNSKGKPKHEKFYLLKRGLTRKADQLKKNCNCDVFVIAHFKDTNKVFSYSTDEEFTFQKVS